MKTTPSLCSLCHKPSRMASRRTAINLWFCPEKDGLVYEECCEKCNSEKCLQKKEGDGELTQFLMAMIRFWPLLV